MQNLFLLPTEKPSRLHKAFDREFILSTEPTVKNDLYQSIPKHLYITSNEEIKTGDKSLLIIDGFEPMILTHHEPVEDGYLGKKIILTTDQDLIADGVQAIDNDFLEWFVKNPSCEFVEVDREEREVGNHLGGVITEYGDYKITIPQEKTKQQKMNTTMYQKYEEYQKAYPGCSNEEIINRVGNELSDKVQEIHKLLDYISQLERRLDNKKRLSTNRNDAKKVFPEFQKKILGYYEIVTSEDTHGIFCICALETILENENGKKPHYIDEDHNYVDLTYWYELPVIN
jgi:hypothetical protein